MDEPRIIEGQLGDDDRSFESGLRPRTLAEYVGQASVCDNLRVFIQAARGRGDSLDHVLLFGPPGLGKTTLAHVIAHEMEVNVRVTSGPVIERPGDLAAILTNLEPGEVLFIDEIHRLSSGVEEILYPALEDFKLDLVIGQGPSARTVRLDLPRFTLVGASTRIGLLTSPLRDRFGIVHHLEFYSAPDLLRILERSAHILGIEARPEGLRELARRSRGTPRVANRLLRRVRDFAQVDGDGVIDADVAHHALSRLGVDSSGLDLVDRRVLSTIAEKFGGGPVGLGTLAAAVGEDTGTVEDIYEPYLIMLGFLKRTPRGRCVTPAAIRHLGLKVEPRSGGDQSSLWPES